MPIVHDITDELQEDLRVNLTNGEMSAFVHELKVAVLNFMTRLANLHM